MKICKILLLLTLMVIIVSCAATFGEPVGSYTLDKKVSECKTGEKYLYLGMIGVDLKKRGKDLFDNVMVPQVSEDLVSNIDNDFSKAVYRLMEDKFNYDLVDPLKSYIKTAKDSLRLNEDLQELVLTSLKDTVKIMTIVSENLYSINKEEIQGYCLNTHYRSSKKNIKEFCESHDLDGIVVGFNHTVSHFKYTSSYPVCSNISWKPIKYVTYVQVISKNGNLKYIISDLTSTPGFYLKGSCNTDALQNITAKAIFLTSISAQKNTLENMGSTMKNKGYFDNKKMVPLVLKNGKQYLVSFPEENDSLMNEEVICWVKNYDRDRYDDVHDFLSQVKIDFTNTDFDTTTTFEGRASKSMEDMALLPRYKYAYIIPDTLKITLDKEESIEDVLSLIPFYFFALRSELELGKFWAFPIIK